MRCVAEPASPSGCLYHFSIICYLETKSGQRVVPCIRRHFAPTPNPFHRTAPANTQQHRVKVLLYTIYTLPSTACSALISSAFWTRGPRAPCPSTARGEHGRAISKLSTTQLHVALPLAALTCTYLALGWLGLLVGLGRGRMHRRRAEEIFETHLPRSEPMRAPKVSVWRPQMPRQEPIDLCSDL